MLVGTEVVDVNQRRVRRDAASATDRPSRRCAELFGRGSGRPSGELPAVRSLKPACFARVVGEFVLSALTVLVSKRKIPRGIFFADHVAWPGQLRLARLAWRE
jgi:hypothetical protein